MPQTVTERNADAAASGAWPASVTEICPGTIYAVGGSLPADERQKAADSRCARCDGQAVEIAANILRKRLHRGIASMRIVFDGRGNDAGEIAIQLPHRLRERRIALATGEQFTQHDAELIRQGVSVRAGKRASTLAASNSRP